MLYDIVQNKIVHIMDLELERVDYGGGTKVIQDHMVIETTEIEIEDIAGLLFCPILQINPAWFVAPKVTLCEVQPWFYLGDLLIPKFVEATEKTLPCRYNGSPRFVLQKSKFYYVSTPTADFFVQTEGTQPQIYQRFEMSTGSLIYKPTDNLVDRKGYVAHVINTTAAIVNYHPNQPVKKLPIPGVDKHFVTQGVSTSLQVMWEHYLEKYSIAPFKGSRKKNHLLSLYASLNLAALLKYMEGPKEVKLPDYVRNYLRVSTDLQHYIWTHPYVATSGDVDDLLQRARRYDTRPNKKDYLKEKVEDDA